MANSNCAVRRCQRMDTFRFLKQFNDPANALGIDRRKRLVANDALAFPGEGLQDRFARALCANRAAPFREVVEAFEFFSLARQEVQAPVIADLCGGHGLVAVLFVMFERMVERAVVLDHRRPGSFDRVLAAAAEVAPWTAGKIEYVAARLRQAPRCIPAEAGLVAVHACGLKTDHVLDLAIGNRAPVAVMPCCHPIGKSPAPAAIKQALGPLAVDIDRTYRLTAAGYHVRWSSVAEQITRMNRVMLARFCGTEASGSEDERGTGSANRQPMLTDRPSPSGTTSASS